MSFNNPELLSHPQYQAHATGAIVFQATSSCEIFSIELHNDAPSAMWFKLYYPLTGSFVAGDSGSYKRLAETLSAGQTLEYARKPITLRNGEAIYIAAQQSSSVNVSVIGRVEP